MFRRRNEAVRNYMFCLCQIVLQAYWFNLYFGKQNTGELLHVNAIDPAHGGSWMIVAVPSPWAPSAGAFSRLSRASEMPRW